MENKILFYELNGTIEKIEQLNTNNLGCINGMMTKCTLKNDTIKIGFADPFRAHEQDSFDNKVHDYIYLWTWVNLDETTHKLFGSDKYSQTFQKVYIADMVTIESILHSNPRWGGKLTNKFFNDDANPSLLSTSEVTPPTA